MSLQVDKLENNMAKLTIEVPAEELEKAIEGAYQKNKNRINIPGFRKGKAPRAMVMRMVGEDYFYEDAVNMTYSDAYEKALEESGLEPVDRADVELKEVNGEGYTFVAKVTTRPEVTLGEYKGLEAVREDSAVTEEEVQSELDRMADRNSRLVDVDDRPAENGDTTEIDFEGFLDGVAFPGGKGEKYTLVLGSNQFIPGFEDQLVGHNTGEEFEIAVKFPEDYHEESLKGKDTTFKVTIHAIRKKEVPVQDDEFAKDVSEFDTLDELKKDVREKMLAEREEAAKRAFEDAAMSKVAAGIQADIPDAMIEEQAKRFVDNFRMQLQSQGVPYEEYMKMTGMEEEKLLADARVPAEGQVRMDRAIAAIVKAESLEASDEDVEAEYNKMAAQYGMDVENVKKYLDDAVIKEQIVRAKAVELVAAAAVPVKPEEVKAEEPKAEEPAEEPKPEKPKRTRKKKAEPKPEEAPAAEDAQ